VSLDALTEPDRRWMKKALREAERAFEAGEVPVGAVVVQHDESGSDGDSKNGRSAGQSSDGRLVGRGQNRVEALDDPTAHAEMLALTAASETLERRRLTDCTLYVTLEPCPMCAGALVQARLGRLVFGAFDEKAGAASTLYQIPQDERLNHRVEVTSGLEEERAAGLLQAFFQKQRA
jgi:tRNA(adenine34) deaminase